MRLAGTTSIFTETLLFLYPVLPFLFSPSFFFLSFFLLNLYVNILYYIYPYMSLVVARSLLTICNYMSLALSSS